MEVIGGGLRTPRFPPWGKEGRAGVSGLLAPCALTWGDASPATGTQRRTAARVGSGSVGDSKEIGAGHTAVRGRRP